MLCRPLTTFASLIHGAPGRICGSTPKVRISQPVGQFGPCTLPELVLRRAQSWVSLGSGARHTDSECIHGGMQRFDAIGRRRERNLH